MRDAEVIIVGGGHNGLICGAYLARAGVRTTIIEARPQVGGCASTVDALGARVNICNCDHVPVRSLPLADELGLDRFGLRYVDLDPVQVALSWTADPPAISFHDIDRTIAALAVTHPDQVEGYRRYLDAALPVARLVLELGAQRPTPRRLARPLVAHRAQGLATLLRWSRRSAADLLRTFFTSETLMGAIVATGPAVWGLPPNAPGTGLGILRPALLHTVAPGRPVGGSGAFTDAVRASFEAAGGISRLGASVDRILLEAGRVSGVRLRGGETLRAGRVVVACDPAVALLEWLDAPPDAARRLLDRWRSRPVLDGYESKVDAVVGELPRYPDLDERLLNAVGLRPDDVLVPTTVLAPGVDGFTEAHRQASAGQVAERPMMLVNVPSVADPTMRAGTGGRDHVFSLEVLFTPYALAGGWPASREPARWLEMFASRCEPGFLDGVRSTRAMTPDRYETELGLRRGYAPSYAGGPLAALLGRQPELTRYRTPIEGLFLTGAATYPGAGVWGASGRNTSAVVLESLDVTRPRPRPRVRRQPQSETP